LRRERLSRRRGGKERVKRAPEGVSVDKKGDNLHMKRRKQKKKSLIVPSRGGKKVDERETELGRGKKLPFFSKYHFSWRGKGKSFSGEESKEKRGSHQDKKISKKRKGIKKGRGGKKIPKKRVGYSSKKKRIKGNKKRNGGGWGERYRGNKLKKSMYFGERGGGVSKERKKTAPPWGSPFPRGGEDAGKRKLKDNKRRKRKEERFQTKTGREG